MIELFPWNENFNTGLAEIDWQHRKLVDLLNQLASQVASGVEVQAVGKIFDELADYAVYHFTTEEAIWHTYLASDSEARAHIAIHAAFVKEVSRLKAALLSEGSSFQVAEEAMGFLARWLASHILETDRQMAYVVNAMQQGLPIEAAKKQAKEKMAGTTRALVDVILTIYTKHSSNMLNLIREFSDRKSMTDALEEKTRALVAFNRNFEALLYQTTDFIYFKDIDSRILFCSQSLAAITGHRDWHEMIGKHDHEVFPPDIAKIYEEEEALVFAERRPLLDKIDQFYDAVGDIGYVQTNKWPLFDETGQIAGIFGIGRDITARNRAEEALQQSQERLRLILDSTAEAIYGIDLDGKCTFCNSACLRILGYSDARDLIGKDMHELIHHSHTDGTHFSVKECRIYQAFQTEQGTHVDDEVLWKADGTSFPAEYWSYPQTLGGRVVGAAVTFVDITARKQAEEASRESEKRFQIMADHAPVLIWIAGTDKLCFWFNKIWLDFTGRTMEQEMGNGWAEGVHPEDFQSCLDDYVKAFDARKEFNLEYRLRRFDGEYRWLSDNGIPRYDDHGVFLGYIGSCIDITSRKNAEDEVRIAATAFEAQEGMLVTDSNGEILRVNRAFTSITGYTSDEVIGKNPRLLSSGRHDSEFYASMWKKIKEGGTWEGEIWNKRKSGEVYPEHLAITAVKDPNGHVSNYVATLTDITMSKAAAEKIENLAFYDSLTNLPNRRLLLDRLRVALASSNRSGRRGALLFLDLDHFKTLNDTLGHDVGDELLKQVAERLTACVREGDTVARLGGDEFVVMLEELSEHALEAATQIEDVGNKILASLNQPYVLGNHSHHSTTSIGVAMFIEHTLGIEELLKQADIAMYQAKKAGRNTLRFFDPKMQESIHARALLESELHEAIEKKQFELYYQIQVDSEGQALGAEALIRWIHPVRGVVSPVEFIPLAEETGMILPIGEWVLETACAQLKLWEADSKTDHLQLAINVSAKQFRQPEFVEQVCLAVQRHSFDSEKLKLELTESVMLENAGANIDKMNDLKKVGVLFSIDDFGTGYSSLSYITQLPLDRLKIDQSFVCNLGEDPRDDAILHTIIGMAENLGLQVIAEGVETDRQLAILRQYGCTQYQGYLFSKPVPLDVFEQLVRDPSAFGQSGRISN